MRRLVSAVSLVLAVSGTLVGARPAQAGVCLPGVVCVYEDVNFGGGHLTLPVHHHEVSNKLAHQFDNQASSIDNNTDFAVILYENKNGKGERICVAANTDLADFTSVFFNDEASSSKVTKKTSCL